MLTITPGCVGGHLSCRFAGAVEDTAGVDREDPLPRVVVGLEHRDAREHARVVDPDVEAAEFRDGRGGRGADGCGIRDVHADADDIGVGSTRDVGCRVPCECLVDVGDRDSGAGLGEAERDRLSEPAGPAGDECAAAGEGQQFADG